MTLHASAVPAAPCHQQRLGWDLWSCPAVLMGVTPFLACITPFPLGNPLLNICHLFLDVCHPFPSKCHLFLACVMLFPACVPPSYWCVPPPSQCKSPPSWCVSPYSWHAPSLSYHMSPIYSMSSPFQDELPCSQQVSPLCVLAGLFWGTLLLMEFPLPWQSRAGKNPTPTHAWPKLAGQQSCPEITLISNK